MKKWTYLFVYLLPITVYAAFNLSGFYTFLPIIIFYGLVPLLELIIPANHHNSTNNDDRQTSKYFDIVLYLAVPVQVGFLFYFFNIIGLPHTTTEYIGMTLSMGLMCGVFGINIAHELGHRNTWYEKLMAEILLLTSLEMHFLPYHNNGHHHNVATPGDPATAKKNESVYVFWFKSQIASYFEAWKLENKRLKQKGIAVISIQNKALSYTLIQLTFVALIYYFFGVTTCLLFIAAAIFGILLLETVNYIEHYGLLRKKNEHGRYERVMHQHSWNSDHPLGRAMLFELSRHSDHHYKASKKYQTLISLPENPQMPTGYPGMMLFSLFPPLFFLVMNKRL
jgi:alkane 1-monooxygenase